MSPRVHYFQRESNLRLLCTFTLDNEYAVEYLLELMSQRLQDRRQIIFFYSLCSPFLLKSFPLQKLAIVHKMQLVISTCYVQSEIQLKQTLKVPTERTTPEVLNHFQTLGGIVQCDFMYGSVNKFFFRVLESPFAFCSQLLVITVIIVLRSSSTLGIGRNG